MLKIIYGDLDSNNFVYNPDSYFDTFFEDEWMQDSLVKEMILGVDKSTLESSYIINSPFLGPIPPQYLSGGVKTLILINQDSEHIFNASACGENCAEWLLKIAEKKDVVIGLNYLMKFPEPFKIHVLNVDKEVSTNSELMHEAVVLCNVPVRYENGVVMNEG